MLGFKSAILAIFQFCQNVKLEGALSFAIHNCKKKQCDYAEPDPCGNSLKFDHVGPMKLVFIWPRSHLGKMVFGKHIFLWL